MTRIPTILRRQVQSYFEDPDPNFPFGKDASTGNAEVTAPLDGGGNAFSNFAWESGTTANRPSNPGTGQPYFDTDLGQPVWYDGSGWVDSTGASA